jgi:hypothetical protein
MISRRLGRGNEAYYTRVTFRLYVEEADDDANKESALIQNGILGQNIIDTYSNIPYILGNSDDVFGLIGKAGFYENCYFRINGLRQDHGLPRIFFRPHPPG